MKTIIRILLIFLCFSAIQGCVNIFKLSDLRQKDDVFPKNQAKAKALLKEMGIAHGIQHWSRISAYHATYGEVFYGFLGKKTNPFKEDSVILSIQAIPTTSNGQLKILTGKEKGKVWGIQDGQTYYKEENDAIVLKKKKEIKFWLPTYQYFIEFPNRIQEATSLDYLGAKTIDGIKAEGVIASWNTIEPQKDIDQYVIWLEAASKRIIKIDYTVRDAYRFVSGTAHFKNYRDFNGLILPAEMPVSSNLLKKGLLHKMRIIDFKPVEGMEVIKGLLPLKP